MNESEKKYYELCAQMLELLNGMHANSRRYIRRSLWNLLFTPFVMILLLVVTEISKGALLFLWLAALFLTCGFLVFIEYIDTRMMKQARALIGEDEEWIRILEKNGKDAEKEAEAPEGAEPEASGISEETAAEETTEAPEDVKASAGEETEEAEEAEKTDITEKSEPTEETEPSEESAPEPEAEEPAETAAARQPEGLQEELLLSEESRTSAPEEVQS